MIFTELRNSTALVNRLTGLPHNEPAAGEVSFVYLFRQSRQLYQMFDLVCLSFAPVLTLICTKADKTDFSTSPRSTSVEVENLCHKLKQEKAEKGSQSSRSQ